MSTLTPKQRSFLHTLVRYMREHGAAPTIRQLQEAAGLQSSRSVIQYLDALEAAGVIARGEGSRNIRLSKDADGVDTVMVPVVGRVAAGMPILAEENVVDQIPVARSIARGASRYFFLQVHGDSMDRAGIFDGDLVLVRQQATAVPGEVIVALIDDSATVKRLRLALNAAILEPFSTNPRHRPIVVDHDFRIQGVVVATIPKETH
jgi:repressor LexA